ncbi:hypothetical protein HELRODRAFT_163705 [Helobdella robusta]|uniref:Uncharacterized protein n=1 Tax=Helobdella robusta TaxID=6412 RepID=T1EUD5_HELRO|nr:hypothetical protein HELRODRAFT_163705 [Helobdella robusta]ESN96617.1 hypothetical protein HELRODRAFT_163705 [Helobdella robusta]
MDGEDDERFILENLGTVKKTKPFEYQNCPDVGLGDDYTQPHDDDNAVFGYVVNNEEPFMINPDQVKIVPCCVGYLDYFYFNINFSNLFEYYVTRNNDFFDPLPPS